MFTKIALSDSKEDCANSHRISPEKIKYRHWVQPAMMTSFKPYTWDTSRRRSAPQDVFKSYRYQLPSHNLEQARALSNSKPQKNTTSEKLCNQSYSLTLPYKKRNENNKEDEVIKYKQKRHSLRQTSNLYFEHMRFVDGQVTQLETNSYIKSFNRVPYYCNEVFCKYEIADTPLKGKESEEDQINSKPLSENKC